MNNSNALDNHQSFSIWLIPARKYYVQLREIIGGLARQYNTASFEPHMTLISGITDNIESVKNIVNEEAGKNCEIEVDISGTGCGEGFFRTLFISLKITEGLLSLYNSFDSIINRKKSYVLNPHLSLLYRDMDKNELERVKAVIDKKLIFDSITFTGVKTAFPGNRNEQWYDIENWKTSLQTKLKSTIS